MPHEYDERISAFVREAGGNRPFVEHLSEEACDRIREIVCKRSGIPVETKGVALANALESKEILTAYRCSQDAPLSIGVVLGDIHVVPTAYMYVNWAHFNNIDRFESAFLIRHLYDLIYPGGDYLDVFDDSLGWIVSIDYECRIRVLVARNPSER